MTGDDRARVRRVCKRFKSLSTVPDRIVDDVIPRYRRSTRDVYLLKYNPGVGNYVYTYSIFYSAEFRQFSSTRETTDIWMERASAQDVFLSIASKEDFDILSSADRDIIIKRVKEWTGQYPRGLTPVQTDPPQVGAPGGTF